LAVVLVVVGLIAPTAIAAPNPETAAGSAKKAKRCKPSQVRTKVTIAKRRGHRRHRITVCLPRSVKRPASIAAALRKGRAIALKHVSKRVARLLRTKAARRVRAADAARDRRVAAELRPGARAAKVTHQSDTETLKGPPGTHTVQRRDATEWDDEEPNPGTEKKVAIDTTSTRIAGLSSSKSVRLELTQLMSRCPDAGGIGHGVLKYLNSEKQVVDKPGGGRAVHEVRQVLDAKILVHFSDEAKVTSVDVDGDWKWSSTSTLSGQELSTFAAGGGLTAKAGTDGHVSSFNVSVANASSPFATALGVLLGTITVLVPIDGVSDPVSGITRRAGNGTCAKIEPDPASVHVKPSATVPISAGLRDEKDQPLTGVVKAAAAKATVAPGESQADPVAHFTYTALSSVPSGRTDTVTLKHVSKRGRAREKTVTIIYDDPPPPPLPNAYGGTLSGNWDATSTGEHWTYTANVELAYDGDEIAPPPGGPPDRYRRFFVTSGTAQVTLNLVSPFGGCNYHGTGPVDLDPGSQSGSMIVQATAKPAYFLALQSRGKTITVEESGGAGCGGTQPYPVPGIWAQTQSAHTSATATLAGQETVPPPTPFDYETFSRWNLAPR
jgi:hypothetical protein